MFTPIKVSCIERGPRSLIYLPSQKATDYFSYCEEMGCEWEETLNSIEEKLEPAALLTLPNHLTKENQSRIASGIEVLDHNALVIPEDFEVIQLPKTKMLIFQSQPYDNEDDYHLAIKETFEFIDNFDYESINFKRNDELAPLFNFGADTENGARIMVPVE